MKKLTRSVIIGLVIAAVAFFGGYYYGSNRYGQENMSLTVQLNDAKRERSTIEHVNQLIRARLDLYRASGELDQRNFGLAQTHLTNAAAHLKRIDAAAAGIDAQALDQLRNELGAVNLTVAVDLEAQRAQVLQFGKQVDALLPAAKPASAEPAAAGASPPAPPSAPASPAPPAPPAPPAAPKSGGTAL